MYPVTREEMEERMRGTTPFAAARKRAVFLNNSISGERACVIDRVSPTKQTVTFIQEAFGATRETVTAEEFNAIFGGWRDNDHALRTRYWRMEKEIAEVWDQAHQEYDEGRMAQAFHADSFEDAMAVVRDVQRREREAAQKKIDRLEDEATDLYTQAYSCC